MALAGDGKVHHLTPIDSIEKGKGVEHKEQVIIDQSGEKVVLDYSGAHEKTDAEEIRLVKKLDKWIMVILCTYI